MKKIIYRLSQYFLLIVIVLYACFLYTIRLGSFPYAVHGDEAETAVQALDIVDKQTGLIGSGWYDIPLLSFFPHTISMELIGRTVAGNRSASVFFGLGTIIFTYLITNLLFGKRPAIIAAFLLTTSHMWIALSRFGTIYTQAGFLVVITFYFFIRGLKNRSNFDFILSGVFFALCFYTYFGARIAPVIMLPLVVSFLAYKKTIRKYIFQLLFFILTAIIIFAPQGIFFYNNPSSFLSRIKYISVTNYKSEQAYQNQTFAQILVSQTKKTYEGILSGDNSGQYGFNGQLFDFASIFFATVGIIGILLRREKWGVFFIFWLFTSLIIGQILTLGPPPIFLPRFVVGLPTLFILCALGIEYMLYLFKNGTFAKIAIIILIGYITFNNLYIYFFMYPIQHLKGLAGDPNAYNATMIANLVNAADDDTTNVFISEPYIYAEFSPFRFLNPNKKRASIGNASDMKFDNFKPVKNATYIIYYPFATKLSILKGLYPHGKSTNYYMQDTYRFTIFKPV